MKMTCLRNRALLILSACLAALAIGGPSGNSADGAVAPLSAWGLSSAENMGRINRPVLGGLLALPIILFGIFFKSLEASLGSLVNTVIVLGVILTILAFLYMFRRAIWQMPTPVTCRGWEKTQCRCCAILE